MRQPSNRKATAPIGVFLGLTLVLSTVFWWLMIREGSISAGGGQYVAGLMWMPGVAGMATALVFRRGLRGFGWRLGRPRYLALGYVVPPMAALLAYGTVWLVGLGEFAPRSAVDQVAQQLGLSGQPREAVVAAWLAVVASVGVLFGVLTALGEEIGWRGFLVPELSARLRFRGAAVLSGAIWAAWHYPLLLMADYNAGTPAPYALACFTAMVVGAGVLYARIRLQSGSLWPAVLLHASHNAFVQNFFDGLTGDVGPTPYLTGEFGVLLALASLAIAVFLWRRAPRVEGVHVTQTGVRT
jgi:membrane protease YdiL (CAAX protease family)